MVADRQRQGRLAGNTGLATFCVYASAPERLLPALPCHAFKFRVSAMDCLPQPQTVNAIKK
jgi:hypothetical protein